MAKRKKLSRDTIIKTLVNALKPLDYVHAFYEGGAAAYNRIDEFSDVDAYAVVNDDKVKETFLAVDEALTSLSPIRQKLEVPQTGWPGISQAFYKLEHANEYLIIDFAVLTLSSTEKFLEPKIHGNNVFYFNKSRIVSCPPLDRDAFAKKLQERAKRLRARREMFNNFVQKEISRGNWLEAIDLYHVLTLGALVEALRMKHKPFHYDFKMRYVHYELPSDVIARLERLYYVRHKKDLQKKYREATEWFDRTMSEIDQKGIRSQREKSRADFGCWFARHAPVAFGHVMDYYVQTISLDPDVLKRSCDALYELRFLLLCSPLPHLNNHDWHDITSVSMIEAVN